MFAGQECEYFRGSVQLTSIAKDVVEGGFKSCHYVWIMSSSVRHLPVRPRRQHCHIQVDNIVNMSPQDAQGKKKQALLLNALIILESCCLSGEA
jgi:hypothetical protein